MECPNCAGKNRDTARYCTRCGQQLGSASASMLSSPVREYVSRPEQLTQGIVRILDAKGNIAGTGFVISESGLIATCSHVIQSEKLQRDGERHPEKVTIVYHATGDKQDARIEANWWLPWDAGDLAILRVEGVLPQGVQPLPLGSAEGTSGHDICTFGFPYTGDIEGIGGDGKVVRGLTRAGRSVIQLRSSEITVGFSGAPIWDKLKRRVIGMVSDITEPVHHRLAETAFAITTETLQNVCAALQISEMCPYRGLAAFREDDAEFFFGRQQVIDGLLNRLRREPRFLTILGPSGSGKSSAVQAGFIPQLKSGAVPGSDRWGVIITRPTDNPFDELAKQGMPDGSLNLTERVRSWLSQNPERERLMLVFDQFEELFVTCPEALRQDFVAQLTQLLHAPLPITVILVMRDDFYSRLTQHEALVQWLELSRGPIHVPLTLKQDELIAMVQKPAVAVGLRFEEGLVEAIVKDTMEAAIEAEDGGQAGRSSVLPLLEFALSELWKRRREGLLTHEAYGRIGAVVGALTQWADGAFFALNSDEQRQLAHRIFTDLIYLGDGGQGILDSRRRRTLASLYRTESERQLIQQVIQQLVEHRLLVTDRDLQTNNEVVEIIHDALLRTWGRLKQWVDEDRDFLLWHQKLEEKTREWIETDAYHPAKRDAEMLLGKRDLAAAKEWQKNRKDDLGPSEHAFIDLSEQRQHKIVNRRRVLFTVLSLLSVIAIVLASVAEINFQRAQAQSQLAAMQKAIAASRQLAAQATNHLDDNLDLALLLSIEANHIGSTPEAKDSLLRALEHQPHLAGLLPNFSSGAESIAFSPNGKMLAVGGQDQTFTLWDVASRRPLFPPIRDQLNFSSNVIIPAKGPVNSLAFSPDGKILATGTDASEGTFKLWDVQSKRSISPSLPGGRGVSDLAFNPKGNILAVSSTDGTFSLWDVPSQKLLGTHLSWTDAGSGNSIRSDLVFSPDGQVLAVSNADSAFSLPARFTLWDVSSQRLLGTHLTGGKSPYGTSLAFSPDGENLAVGSDNNSASLWDVKSQHSLGAPLTNTKISQVNVSGSNDYPDSSLVAFSPAGQILAVGSSSGTITLWDTATHQIVDEIKTNSSLAEMIFSSDGGLLATIGDGSHVGLWHTFPTQPLAHLITGAGKPALPEVRPDGTVIDGAYLGGYFAAVSPHGDTIVVVHCNDVYYERFYCPDPTMRLWNTTSHQQLDGAFTGPPGIDGVVPAFALSPDGKFLAIAGCSTQDCKSGSGELLIWNVTSHQLLGNPIFTNLPLDKVAYSPDGKILAAYGDSPANYDASGIHGGDVIYLWGVATGRFLGSIGSITSGSKSFNGNSFAFKPGSDIITAPYCSHFTKGACSHVQIGLWDPQDLTHSKEIIGDANIQYPDNVIWNPNGVILATNGTVLWNVDTGKPLSERSPVYPLAFTPDSTMLIANASNCPFNYCKDPTIQLLDASTLNPVGPPLAVYSDYFVEGIQISENTNVSFVQPEAEA